MNFQRLNHMLIPSTKAGRDRLRKRPLMRLVGPAVALYRALSIEGMALVILCLLAGVEGSITMRSSQVFALWSLSFSLLLGSLMVRQMFRLREVRVRLELPANITVGELVHFTLVIHNGSKRDHQCLRISGPLLPWDGSYQGPLPGVRELPAGRETRVDIPMKFIQRGEHHLDPFVLKALVPLGFAVGPGVSTQGIRFLVVPRVAPVERLRTPTVQRYQPGGVALASRTGESLEFIGVRPYRRGDPVRDLHARSWARTGQPVVREYRQEYFTRIGVVVDVDKTAGSERQLEAVISLAAGLVAHLSRGEALIDILVVGEEVHQLTLGRSLGFLEQALELLACVEAGPALDPERLVNVLAPHLRQLSCVVMVVQTWDTARRLLRERVANQGIGCKVLMVADVSAGDPEVLDVELQAIEQGRELLL